MMKLSSPPLIGNFFLPSLGLAVFSLAIGYWLSRKKNKDPSNEPRNNVIENRSDVTDPGINSENPKPRKKKHKCECGSDDTSKFDGPPSQIKIMYGTLLGKSKVQHLICHFLSVCVLTHTQYIFQKFANALLEHVSEDISSCSIVNLRECDSEDCFIGPVSSIKFISIY